MTLSYSLCVLHHGDPRLTEACLRSTLALSARPIESIVLWNDPGTSAVALSDEVRRRVRIVDSGGNLGFAGGANAAIRAAGELGVDAVWLLNNDTEVEPDTAGELLRALGEDSGIAVVGPRIVRPDDRIWHDGGWIEWPSARPRSRGFGERTPVSPESSRDVEFVSGCAPLIRRETFEAVGGFDERYWIFYEDADLSLRLRKAGCRLVHVPTARVRHRGSATAGETTPLSRYYRLRNRLLFSSEHAPDPDTALRERRKLCRRSRRRAWRHFLTGRRPEARAVLAALADAQAGRWGRWD